ncbi:MAG: putative TRAP-type C4-dicarboxylate transport system, DctQ subunit [Hyphomicrobiales bacterium]|nr:putative TRAP-type C4-dicarboxylate transport system, DctQ subunit [Hyphomicrobiales bacterium]
MSAHGFELPGAASAAPERLGGVLGAAQRALAVLNKTIVVLASIALIAASLILSYSVVVRYYFKAATYWQDEAAVFLLVGATFLTAAYVQSRRGHVAIDAAVGFLSPAANRIRLLAVDVVSFLFCAFFSWKSWTLFHEAWEDGQVTSSTWGPPLWIPYAVMAAGMSLLCVQIALQILIASRNSERA